MSKKIYILIIISCLTACGGNKGTQIDALNQLSKHQQTKWLRKISQIIVADIFPAPATSRIYAYTQIAAYEALLPAYPNLKSYATRLNGLTTLPNYDTTKTYYFPISSIIAMTTVAQKLVFDGKMMAQMEQDYLKSLKNAAIDAETLNNSIQYGQFVGNHILAWAQKDGYLQRTSYGGYMVQKKDESTWQPTPPDYMDAAEPNWHTLRPFALDSARQFTIPPPPAYSTQSNSDFYRQAKQVRDVQHQLTETQRQIALFWDDNPNTSITQGHVTYFQQKLSPAGHWMHLAASLIEKENLDLGKSAQILSQTAIAIADGFMGCWAAKYKYRLVRPETFITKYLEKEWMPLIQTPPFPEYPSGHSVISSSAVQVLSHHFGTNYAYTDSIEAQFGLPIRNFNSFDEAAIEASQSRLYGGIHYEFGINAGRKQGQEIGQYITQHCK